MVDIMVAVAITQDTIPGAVVEATTVGLGGIIIVIGTTNG
jgi:hypothetical protein